MLPKFELRFSARVRVSDGPDIHVGVQMYRVRVNHNNCGRPEDFGRPSIVVEDSVMEDVRCGSVGSWSTWHESGPTNSISVFTARVMLAALVAGRKVVPVEDNGMMYADLGAFDIPLWLDKDQTDVIVAIDDDTLNRSWTAPRT